MAWVLRRRGVATRDAGATLFLPVFATLVFAVSRNFAVSIVMLFLTGAADSISVIIRQTQAGTSYGHSGFFPGYLTDMMYFPDASTRKAPEGMRTSPVGPTAVMRFRSTRIPRTRT